MFSLGMIFRRFTSIVVGCFRNQTTHTIDMLAIYFNSTYIAYNVFSVLNTPHIFNAYNLFKILTTSNQYLTQLNYVINNEKFTATVTTSLIAFD